MHTEATVYYLISTMVSSSGLWLYKKWLHPSLTLYDAGNNVVIIFWDVVTIQQSIWVVLLCILKIFNKIKCAPKLQLNQFYHCLSQRLKIVNKYCPKCHFILLVLSNQQSKAPKYSIFKTLKTHKLKYTV